MKTVTEKLWIRYVQRVLFALWWHMHSFSA